VTVSKAGVVVCHPLRAAALQSIAQHLPVAGVVSTGRKLSTDIPCYDDVRHALNTGADLLIALSPYRGLSQDIELCLSRDVRVITAGPTPEAHFDLCAAGRWRFQPSLARLIEAQTRPAFQTPVFLRHFGGGGCSLLGLWWAALEGLELAVHVLGPPRQLWVAATGGRGRWHANITVLSENNATAQLAVTPTAMPGDDVLLLGTGGIVWHEGIRDAVIHQVDDGARLINDDAVWPDGPWAAATLAGADGARHSAVHDATRLELLTVLRAAARSGRPEALSMAGPVRHLPDV